MNHFDADGEIFVLCVPLSLPLLPSILAVLLKGMISTLTPLPFCGVRLFADCPHALLGPSPAPGPFPLSPEPQQIFLCQLSLLHTGSLWKPVPSILLGFKCSEHVLAAFRSTVHLVSWPAYSPTYLVWSPGLRDAQSVSVLILEGRLEARGLSWAWWALLQ